MEEICQALHFAASGGGGGGDDDDDDCLVALQHLLDAQPEVLQRRDRMGDLPLHAMCSSRYDEFSEEVASLLAQHHTKLQVIQWMVDRYPQALRVLNAHGMLPLHMSAWFFHSTNTPRQQQLDIIRYLVQQYPAAVTMADESGYRPISFVLAKMAIANVSWDDAADSLEFLLQESPASLWHLDERGILPLQYASVAVPQNGMRLIQLYCRTTTMISSMRAQPPHPPQNDLTGNAMLQPVTDTDGKTPIHVAIASHTKLEIIQTMIHAVHPMAIHVPDQGGRLPLHSLIVFIMKHIFDTKSTAQQYQRQQQLQFQSMKQKLQWVIQMDPSALTRQDCHGKTSLHLLLEQAIRCIKQQQQQQQQQVEPDKDETMKYYDAMQYPRTTTSTTSTSSLQQQQMTQIQSLVQILLLLLRLENNHARHSKSNSKSNTNHNACHLVDENGNLPLHLAVMFLRERQPQQPQYYTTDTTTTTTIAMETMIDWIVAANPGAVEQVNRNGKTPLQLLALPIMGENSSNNNNNNNNNNHGVPLGTIYTLVREAPYPALLFPYGCCSDEMR